jgi:hypothetical protein
MTDYVKECETLLKYVDAEKAERLEKICEIAILKKFKERGYEKRDDGYYIDNKKARELGGEWAPILIEYFVGLLTKVLVDREKLKEELDWYRSLNIIKVNR